jgi:hypothetical protein
MDEIQDPFRQARFRQYLYKFCCTDRGVTGGFENNRIAADEGWKDLPWQEWPQENSMG